MPIHIVHDLGSRRLKDLNAGSSLVGVTLGNFDGMHLGHQELFRLLNSSIENRLSETGARRPPLKVLLTFDPHPRRAIAGIKRSELALHPEYQELSSLRDKAAIGQEFGFDLMVVCHFSAEFRSLTPRLFADKILREKLQAEVVVIGHDWGFGRDRSGSGSDLASLGKEFGFEVQVAEPVIIDGVRVSSGLIKRALQEGDLRQTEKFLGRRYSIWGRIRRGARRGGTLGFPTANLVLTQRILPKDGVYGCFAELHGKRFIAATNIGTNPTFGEHRRTVEAHMLDYEGEKDLYGEKMELTFVSRIRDELKFGSVGELQAQIQDDIKEVRRQLAGEG